MESNMDVEVIIKDEICIKVEKCYLYFLRIILNLNFF